MKIRCFNVGFCLVIYFVTMLFIDYAHIETVVAFLVVKAVDLSGISISATYYVVAMTVSLFIGGLLNAARLNNKFKKVQNI